MPKVGKVSDEAFDGRYLIAQFIGGAITGWLVLGAICYLDLSGLWTLLGRSDMWFVAIVMLGTAFGMTFGIAAMATGLCWRGAGRASREIELPATGRTGAGLGWMFAPTRNRPSRCRVANRGSGAQPRASRAAENAGGRHRG